MARLRKDALEEYDIFGDTLHSLAYAHRYTKDKIIDIYKQRVIRYFPEFADDLDIVDPEYDIPNVKHEKGSCLIKIKSSGDIFIFHADNVCATITQLSYTWKEK